jgi:hypothetical protein
MSAVDDLVQDVMQVCRNGHVITDLLRSCPERGRPYCDRCGAATLDRCQTCGQELPGALAVPGLVPVGPARPPLYCSLCGAAFPWVSQPAPAAAPGSLAWLEGVLRRLPRMIRQLRVREGNRPAFRVEDEKDLDDLLRAVLPLHFDDIRPQSRTPRYAAGTRTDFLLAPERIVVSARLARSEVREPQLREQLVEDVTHYCGRKDVCDALVVYIHDPEGVVRDPRALVVADEFEIRCVIGSPG